MHATSDARFASALCVALSLEDSGFNLPGSFLILSAANVPGLYSFLIQSYFGTYDISHIASSYDGRQPKAGPITSANFAQSFKPLSEGSR